MPQSLPRRAFLDVELPPDEQAFSAVGMRIAAVHAGGMAERAGIEGGDILVTLAGLPVRTLAELAAATRRAGEGTTTTIEFTRAGDARASTVDVTRCATEQLPSIDIQYSELAVGDARLRTIATSALRPRAMILVIQGIACESIEGSGAEGSGAEGNGAEGSGDEAVTTDAPLVGLVHGLARAGYDTFRIDKHGVGDSDGGPCNAVDFETEVAGFAAALVAAGDRARELAIPLVVFGHSVGGIIAAKLAAGRHVAAIVTYGAPASPWLDCLVETTRRQMALRGVAQTTIDRAATDLVDRAFVEGLNGRCGEYHRQLDAIDPVTLWSAVTAPVLVVRGEFDWVVRADDQARIATLVGHGSTIIDLPEVDHVMGWHPDQASSLRDYGAGRFDPRIVPPIVAWLDRVLIT